MTTILDVSENRDAVIADVPGEFLNVEMDKEVIIVLEGELFNFMEAISPSTYREYVYVGNNRRNILYVCLQKALYSCICCTLFFY